MKNQKRRILVDVDDTLVLWKPGFKKYMSEVHGLEPVNDHPDGMWRYGVDDPFVYAQDFHDNHPLFAELPPLDCAVENLTKLADAGYTFVAITAVTDQGKCREHRTKNLVDLFGDVFEDIHMTGMGSLSGGAGDKREILARYEPTWWVDDRMHHAVAGLDLGHKSILITAKHNTDDHHPDVPRVKSWHEISDMILTEDWNGRQIFM